MVNGFVGGLVRFRHFYHDDPAMVTPKYGYYPKDSICGNTMARINYSNPVARMMTFQLDWCAWPKQTQLGSSSAQIGANCRQKRDFIFHFGRSGLNISLGYLACSFFLISNEDSG